MKKFSRFTWLSLVLAFLLIPYAGFAQTTRTTGALQGTVSDTQGNPLPGVTVTATSPNLQGPRVAVTDAQGEYLLPSLPPGNYRIEYALTGIQTATRDNVSVNLNQVTRLNVPMQMSVTETVTVTANQVVVDPTQTVTQQNFREDHLKYAVIGSANRSYQNVLQQGAGVAGGSNPNVAGANNAQNTYQLDGINTTDPVTHTFGNNLSFDAIQEISIQTLGKDAEYSASGGTVNVITKSGGNQFSGSGDWRYNDKRLQTQGSEKHTLNPAYYGGPSNSVLKFDKNLQPVKNDQKQVTFGGPIMRDRLWFFAAAHKPATSTTPPTTQGFTPGSRNFDGWNNLAKVTFTPLANHTLTGLFIDSYARISNATNSSFYRPEASYMQTQGARTYGLTYDAILSSKWLANVQLGHTPARLAVLPNSGRAVGEVDNLTAIRSVNYNNRQARTSTRDELNANTTYYLEAMGTHALKGGFVTNKTDFTSLNQNSGDPTLVPGWTPSMCGTALGFPAGTQCGVYIIKQGTITRLNVSPANPEFTVGAKQYAYYAQDEWNPMSQLTIRAGLRYEQVNWDNPKGNNPPSFKLMQPRLGVAYDIFNNANSVIHGYAGKIMDDNQLTLPYYGYEQPSGTVQFNLNSNGTWTPVAGGIFTSGTNYADNLEPAYSNQWSLGFTQKVFRNTSLDITYQKKHQTNLFEDYCGNYTGATRHDLDNCVITNQPGFDVGAPKGLLRGDYKAVIAKLEARPFNWLDGIVSWTHAESKGSSESTQNAAATFDYYPVFFHNTYGFLSDDAKNRIKVDGFVRLPLDFIIGMNYYWDDGVAYTIFQTNSTFSATGIPFPSDYAGVGSYFIEPRGSRRLPSFSQTDLQVQKDFRVGQFKLGVIGSVFNVFNTETATGKIGNAGVRARADENGKLYIDPDQVAGVNRLAANFGQETSWQRPRRFEVGFRFEF